MTKLVPIDTLATFCKSYDRIKLNPMFLDIFYDRFLGTAPELGKMFGESGLARAKRMLRDSLYWAMLACDGNNDSVKHLTELGKYHTNHSVTPDHYDLWLDSLLSAIEECDPSYNIDVDKAWRAVMSVAVWIMKGGFVHDELIVATNAKSDNPLSQLSEEEED